MQGLAPALPPACLPAASSSSSSGSSEGGGPANSAPAVPATQCGRNRDTMSGLPPTTTCTASPGRLLLPGWLLTKLMWSGGCQSRLAATAAPAATAAAMSWVTRGTRALAPATGTGPSLCWLSASMKSRCMSTTSSAVSGPKVGGAAAACARGARQLAMG